MMRAMRLDQAIAARYPGISRRKARELLAAHRVLVNDRPVAVASRHVSDADRVAILDELPQVPVIGATENWIAVDKPSGLAVQPIRDRSQRSLEELLRVQLKREEGGRELFVVHRLDTGTSGVVLFARNEVMAAKLSGLFAAGEIAKSYLAVVEGSFTGEQTIDTPIARESESRFTTGTDDGKNALTIVKALRPRGERTLVEVEIKTGRTHQIRVHLASIGHPVTGDRKYGSGTAGKRLMLQAWRLAHPLFGELVSPPPPEFENPAATAGVP
jgi:23S rRNA pseudouridine1911/1915/1917 synthase